MPLETINPDEHRLRRKGFILDRSGDGSPIYIDASSVASVVPNDGTCHRDVLAIVRTKDGTMFHVKQSIDVVLQLMEFSLS